MKIIVCHDADCVPILRIAAENRSEQNELGLVFDAFCHHKTRVETFLGHVLEIKLEGGIQIKDAVCGVRETTAAT